MKTYNGFRSWNAWNVSLWIYNDFELYNYSIDLIKAFGVRGAVKRFCSEYNKTPDGAKYNKLSVTAVFKELDAE